ncbi:Type I restriction-modification system specificity subunit [Streptococcus pyogenes]|uniref:restriction endonuclease subunit S n=12 Tax=Streptococcus pyogenes TaxID=1314 RepID=UPI000DA2F2A9|nr:restriction endonuclease subunit S [Streptococcus pyogenes]SQG28990.1 Type I restriction-modification system specificity subunit [Streptococcus pyogenes]VGR64361.1 Type I restriction-modification system specificity subunit [Streptococcus pyogenes]VGR69774.1 Type I restriction-modification system specificity subunit [Streptococcus pyogenes]VGU02165.1 Type I restriction-modification system specificity subunit [Streptococcus pyogenes]VGU21966.1 Type I restriction-modification system specificit
MTKSKQPQYRFDGFEGEWEEKKLGEISRMFSGGTPNVGIPEYYNGNIPFIRSAEINSDQTELSITDKGLSNSSAKLVEKNTLLYALYGATSGEVGLSRISGAINQAILAIIPEKKYSSLFIKNWLYKQKSSIIEKYLQGGQGNLSGSIVKELTIHFPSLPEQEAIGELFQTVDQLLQLQDQKLATLKEQKQTFLRKMSPAQGQKVPEIRLQGFDGEWEEKKLGEISRMFSGGTPNVGIPEYYNGNIPFIRSAEINSDQTELSITDKGLSNSSAKLVEKNTLLYALYGATSGEVGLSRISGAINQAILAIIPEKKYSSLFIKNWLYKQKSSIIEKYLQGGQGNLSGSIVKELTIHFPSLSEQEAIGNFFQTLDQQIAQSEEKLTELKALKQTLLNRLFV